MLLKVFNEMPVVRPLLKTPVAILVIFTVGCSKDADYKRIDFSEKVIVAQPAEKKAKGKKLRVAVGAMISPKETFIYYRELLEFIGKKLDHDVELIQRKTYGEINELFREGQIDLAFICTGPYVSGQDKYGFEAIATPVVHGKPFYQSYLIVHKSSSARRLEDLRGQVFAFTDPESNTGTLVPNYWLSQMDETPQTFFMRAAYTYSHDNSILAVAKKLVDGAAVDSHIWEFYNQRNSFYTSKTRVIKKSIPFGSPPLVTSAILDDAVKARLRNVVLSMHSDPDGMQILSKLMIDRFTAPKQAWYAPVRILETHVQANEAKKNISPQS